MSEHKPHLMQKKGSRDCSLKAQAGHVAVVMTMPWKESVMRDLWWASESREFLSRAFL